MVWDKGSSGLVFYTDASYWDEQEGGMPIAMAMCMYSVSAKNIVIQQSHVLMLVFSVCACRF